MSGKTSIEWATMSWNPVTGCTRVSDGCDFCYAFTLHNQRHEAYKRFNGVYSNGTRIPEQYAKPFSEMQLLPQRLEDPLKIKTPQRIFVNSMSDLFHKDVPDDFIAQVFETMNRAQHHIFQVLTKRPSRAALVAHKFNWTPNIWMGTSVENDQYVWRANKLREVPATVRFLSCEPLLGPLPSLSLEGLSWIIVGGESGHGARPMNPDWVRDIRDRCVEAEVAFFFKQHGGRTPKAGGRELDGRTWSEFPSVEPLVVSQSSLL